jgi:ATP-dependent helicase/nuclease subunit A
VRPLAALPGGESVSGRVPNPEQKAAIEAQGLVFVSAGAGTGKTMVLVERFARALLERGLPIDSLLVITYTERAAGELRSRIRAALVERGRADLARGLDGAWISTIHGLCSRLLRQNAVAAGIDPRFRVLDEGQSLVLRYEAFAAALEGFCADGDPGRTALVVSYGREGLRRMIISVHETLRSAGRPLELELCEARSREEAEAELRREAETLAADEHADEEARLTARELIELVNERNGVERLLDLSEFKLKGERAESFEEARAALEQAAWDELALRDRELVQKLLEEFERAYRAAKDAASALDFEDLQLYARALLSENPAVLRRERSRLRSIMVDEFQDTNRLQCELIDLLAGEVGANSSAKGEGVEELFFVGDEFQSIYRFRHADVDVFRERRSRSGGVLALTHNYRSRPEVLKVVNELFASDFGAEYRPLEAAAETEPGGPAVELLVTDKASYAGSDLHWRRAEARRLAARIHELVAAGEAAPGEIVLLFAAGTDAEWYEQELRALGLPTYRAAGRGYYGQQQVVDLLAYLRLLHNRYDDEALCAVLASPFVGVSNDALVLLRRSAAKRPLYCGLERGFPEGLAEKDERLFRAFRQRYERLATASESVSLELLCEQIMSEHDYDLALLAQWDGRRRYANARKLARMARSFEELRGPDIEAFVRFVADLGLAGANGQEAVAEEEGADAVRLLTIHAAKGLEFRVVVVADAGRAGGRPSPDEILCLPDGRFGFRVADPAGGRRRPALGYDEVRAADQIQAEAERRRLTYVAMTRAIERLIVSGAIDFEKKADGATPIGWVLSQLGLSESELRAAEPVEISRGQARLALRVDRYSPAADEVVEAEPEPVDEKGQLSLFGGARGLALEAEPEPIPAPLAPLEPVPAPPLHRPRRLSFSSLRLYESCPYRYFAERVVGMKPRASGPAPAEGGLTGLELGSAVHELLERIDLTAPEALSGRALAEAVRDRYPQASDDDLARIERLVAGYCSSELAQRVAGLPHLATELPFVFEERGVLVNGYLDVLSRGEERALVLDYKTNLLEGAEPEEVVERDYRLQRLVYALACLRAGYREVEVVYAFLEQPEAVVSRTYRPEAEPALVAELNQAIEAVERGEFRPTPGEYVCSDCPARGLVCAGTDLPGWAPRSPALAPVEAV